MRKAIEVLSQTLLDYIGSYPACLQYDPAADYSPYRCIFIGTKSNHPYIAKNAQSIPNQAEAYSISVQNDTVIIEGADDAVRGEGDRFGVVLKGMTKLDWPSFEHLDGPISLGTSSDAVKADRINRKSRDWKYFQAYWMANGKKAREMIRILAECKQSDLHITALVEDGMFEENIMYPVARYSEMLWNYNADFSKLLSEVALRNYVTFA